MSYRRVYKSAVSWMLTGRDEVSQTVQFGVPSSDIVFLRSGSRGVATHISSENFDLGPSSRYGGKRQINRLNNCKR